MLSLRPQASLLALLGAAAILGLALATHLASGLWALAVAVPVVVAAGVLADAGWHAGAAARRRREEADLLADLARRLLLEGAERLPADVAAERLGLAVGAVVRVVAATPAQPLHPGERALLLTDEQGAPLASILLPADAPHGAARRLARLGPALGALLAAERQREVLEHERSERVALDRTVSAKTAVLASVSHDLQAPLVSLTIAAAALAAEGIDAADRAALVDAVRGEAARLQRLIGALLDAARVQAHSVEAQLEPVDVVGAARDAAAAAAGTAVDVEAGGSVWAEADPVHLERILENLLVNAAEHGGGREVVVRVVAVGDRARLEVADHGPGVPAALAGHLFEPFTSGRERGGGLGLAVARGFAEAGGGTLEHRHEPPAGACFRLELPRAEPPPGAPPDRAPQRRA